MAKILIIGATGYIGGDALFALLEKHPELEQNITCLVRNSDRGAIVAKKYPKIQFVYGSLDDEEILTQAAEASDIVGHFANCDHQEAATALTTGLSLRSQSSHPAFLIHTSGTGILTWADVRASRWGAAAPDSEPTYDDWDGVSAVTSIPDDAWHRPVDKIVLGSNERGVRTAIVSPPTISGEGRGPGNRRSVQWYGLAKSALERGRGVQVGAGENWWTYVHVQDLSNVYLSLFESALDKIAGGDGGKATWGKEGYYFAEAGPFRWGDIAQRIAKEAKKLGLFETDEVEGIGKEEADKLMPGGSGQWGLNSKCKAIRARKLFGWEPKGENIDVLIPQIVKQEALALGLLKTHAEMAEGV